jgi:hypothetical protein
MYSFFNFNLMCICEHILCFWLVDFFVFSMIGEIAFHKHYVLNFEI